MAVISGANYVAIAQAYATARDSVVSSLSHLFDAVYDVVMLNEIQPEVDLLSEFYNSYQVNTGLYLTPVTFLSAVRALNNHVLNRGGYQTLDAFLDVTAGGGPFTVPQTWADLCLSAGFEITDDGRTRIVG